MVRFPTPAALATSSIVVFMYPRTPISRSAASRIRSRVLVSAMRVAPGSASMHEIGFSCKRVVATACHRSAVADGGVGDVYASIEKGKNDRPGRCSNRTPYRRRPVVGGAIAGRVREGRGRRRSGEGTGDSPTGAWRPLLTEP